MYVGRSPGLAGLVGTDLQTNSAGPQEVKQLTQPLANDGGRVAAQILVHEDVMPFKESCRRRNFGLIFCVCQPRPGVLQRTLPALLAAVGGDITAGVVVEERDDVNSGLRNHLSAA